MAKPDYAGYCAFRCLRGSVRQLCILDCFFLLRCIKACSCSFNFLSLCTTAMRFGFLLPPYPCCVNGSMTRSSNVPCAISP